MLNPNLNSREPFTALLRLGRNFEIVIQNPCN